MVETLEQMIMFSSMVCDCIQQIYSQDSSGLSLFISGVFMIPNVFQPNVSVTAPVGGSVILEATPLLIQLWPGFG